MGTPSDGKVFSPDKKCEKCKTILIGDEVNLCDDCKKLLTSIEKDDTVHTNLWSAAEKQNCGLR